MSNFTVQNRIPLMVAVSVAALISLVPYYTQAVNTIAQGKSKISDESTPLSLLDSVMGSGSASILRNEDIGEAKEKALEMAKNEAILKIVGLHVSAEILNKEKENIINYLAPEQDHMIKDFKIVSENEGEDGFYRLKISAKVREDVVKNFLMKNLYDDRIIVITSEKNNGHLLKRHILEHELIKKIKERGYAIVDYRTIKNDRVRDLVSAIRQGNTESVKKMGVYYLTDNVVVGFVETKFSQKNKEIFSANATGQVKIHQIGNKKEVASLTKYNVKGFGSNEEKAGLDAIKKLSQDSAEESIKSLPRNSFKKIKLSIKELGDPSSFTKAKQHLSRLPYVKEVTAGSEDFDREEATLYIKTTKGIEYITKKITELNLFVVKRVHPFEIELEARKI